MLKRLLSLALVLCLLSLAPGKAFFFTASGFRLCGTGADDSSAGTSVWTNPGNITAKDGVFATTPLAGGTSHRLKGTNFGFTNADFGGTTGNTIVGLEFRWKGKELTSGALWVSILACKAGAPGGTNKSPGTEPSTVNTEVTFGTAADLWGGTWVQTDFVGVSTFGFVTQYSAGGATTMSIDSYECQVDYTAAVSGHSKDLPTTGAGLKVHHTGWHRARRAA